MINCVKDYLYGWLMNECVWSSGGMKLKGETEVLREKNYTA